ncbi:MAG: diguanylate cyclase [Clostridiales bacterium]|nr:diguanylate cyclase [Clostridiales bacterium]
MKKLKESTLAAIGLLLILIIFIRYGQKVFSFKYSYIDLNSGWTILFNDKTEKNQDIFLKSVVEEKDKQNKIVKFSREFEIPHDLVNKNLSLSIGGIPFGHKVYINGHMIGESPFEDFVYNDWNSRYSYFIPNEFLNSSGKNNIEIYMQSIYEYGANQRIYIGQSQDVTRNDKFINEYFISIYFALSFINIIIGAYFINLFRLNKFNKKYLYFAITLLLVAIYYSNYFVSSSILGYLGFQKVVFSVLYLSVIAFIMFLRKNYNIEETIYSKVSVGIYLLAVLFMMFYARNIFVFTFLRKRFYVLFFMAFVYMLYLVLNIYKKNKDKKIGYPIVYFIAFMMILNDILIDLSIIKRDFPFHLNSYAIMLILVYMAYDLSREQSNIYINSIIDPLTGLYNRRFLDSYICNAYSKKANYSMLLLDFDNFKIINDTYGHIVGDVVLSTSAKIIQRSIAENCIAARFGGEEFVIFCERNKKATSYLAEEVRKNIANYDWEKETGIKDINVTVSIGAVEFNSEDEFVKVLELVDVALYMAKHKGKNRVEWVN